MSLYECPRCHNETATNATVAGAMEIPPDIYCIHGEEAVKMQLVTEAGLKEEAVVEG